MSKLNVWKTVSFVGSRTPHGYQAELEMRGCQIDCLAKPSLWSINYHIIPPEIRLANASVSELGLVNGGTWEQILAAIRAVGGELCPAEVGPALRLQYPDQPRNEALIIAMETIHSDRPALFTLVHDKKGLWLSGAGKHPSFSPGTRLAVALL